MTKIAPPGKPLVLALVGHKGRMGAMLMRHWKKGGHTVRGVDRLDGATSAPNKKIATAARDSHRVEPGGKTSLLPAQILKKAICGADAVILCVPVAAMDTVLKVAAPFLTPAQVLLDITSVKILPMQSMEAVHQGPVVGTHPLFGPASQAEDQAVAIVPGKNADEDHLFLVESLFSLFGCRLFRTTAEEHDKAVAFVQGLNFISTSAYLASLAQRADVMPFLTPSFRRRLAEARKLLTEDADMFQIFTAHNPLTLDAVRTFRLFLDLAEGSGLPDVVRRARWWYDQRI